jgi:AcrR family transcriptional regulator
MEVFRVGLRERKRQRLHETIIENAVALFRESGFEAVTVRQIAGRCEISEATFFNHFPTKDAVLSRWAYRELDRAFASAATASLRQTLRHVAARLPRALAAEPRIAALAWSRARLSHLRAPDSAIPLIEAAQQRGELRRDVGAAELARLFAGVAALTIATFLDVSDPGAEETSDRLAVRLREALDLVLDGARRRHERVRPGDAATGPVAHT